MSGRADRAIATVAAMGEAGQSRVNNRVNSLGRLRSSTSVVIAATAGGTTDWIAGMTVVTAAPTGVMTGATTAGTAVTTIAMRRHA